MTRVTFLAYISLSLQLSCHESYESILGCSRDSIYAIKKAVASQHR